MFKLPESLTIFNGESVLEQLIQYLHDGTDGQNSNAVVVLNADELHDIDGAGLQILLSVYKMCADHQIAMQLTGVNSELRRMLEITGVQAVIDVQEKAEVGNANE